MQGQSSTNAGKRRSQFGNIRQTSSGRFQARYTAPDGTARKAPHTFRTKTEARQFLAHAQVDQLDGNWRDPNAYTPSIAEFVPHFQSLRRGRGGGLIKAKTLELSVSQLDRYILPALGERSVDQLSVTDVNRWYAQLPDRPVLRRQVYSLLKAVMNLAIKEGLVHSGKNPCVIEGAGQNHYDHRPHMSVEQVDCILQALHGEVRTIAELAFNAHLRLGEVLALEVDDVDLRSRRLTVRRAITEVGNQPVVSSPKSARVRVIDMDIETAEMLRRHIESHRLQESHRLFKREDGSEVRHFHVQSAWRSARIRAGLERYRFHDLRHAGLTLLAEAGVPLSGLMYRAGHSTVAAALNYQSRAESRGVVEAQMFAEQKARQRGANSERSLAR